jgi:polyhydroxyalkanoate synthesis regulator phasin
VGFGVAQLVSDQVGSVVSGLERDGHINRAEGKKMAKKLLAEANKFQRKISSRVDKQVRKVVKSSSSKKSAQKRGAKKKK